VNQVDRTDRSRATRVAVAAGIGFLAVRLPSIVTTPLGVFDEGARLAGGSFAASGLLQYRDYYSPYGPARDLLTAPLHWVGLDTTVTTRLVFFAVALVAATLLAYVVARRRGPGVGAFIGFVAVVFLPSGAGYGETFAIIALLGAVSLLILNGTEELPLAEHAASDRTALVAGVPLGLMAWVRPEFGLVSIVWFLMTCARREGGSIRLRLRPWMLVPPIVGAAPYIVVAAAGGLGNMVEALEYAIDGYADYRAKAPMHRRFEFLRDIVATGETTSGAWTVAMSSTAAMALPLLLADRLTSWHPRLRRLRVFERDETRTHLLVALIAILVWGVTRVRADVFHVAMLVVPLWLAYVWTPLRWRLLEPIIGVAVVLVTISASGLLVITEWSDVPRMLDTERPLHGISHVPIDPTIEDGLEVMSEAWEDDGRPDTVFVANRQNHVTALSAPLIYYVFDARPATWLTMFDPGLADQQAQHETMIEDLCSSRAPAILMAFPALKEVRGLRFSNLLDRFLVLNYDLRATSELFDYRVATNDPCVDPSRIESSRDLEPRLQDVARAGDSQYAEFILQWQQELAVGES